MTGKRAYGKCSAVTRNVDAFVFRDEGTMGGPQGSESLNHVAVSRLRKSRRADGVPRNCEEKVQLKQLSRMPGSAHIGYWTQEQGVQVATPVVETFQGTSDLEVLSGFTRRWLRPFDADRGGSKPENYPRSLN